MLLLDGRAFAEKRQQELKKEIDVLPSQPTLAILRIGEDQASDVYVERKKKFGEAIGAEVGVLHLPADVTFERAQQEIQALNEDQHTDGIILQLPIPSHLNKEALINTISPSKDIDGLSAVNMWRLMDDASGIVPATARGIDTLLTDSGVVFEGSHIVIVGDSLLVGKSTAIHFLNKDATVTVCHDKTKDLSSFTKQADILITAVGKEKLINEFHVREGQVIVDVGITKTKEGNVVGDVDFDAVKDKVAAITPVPGGVGPMTVLSLFENLLEVVKG